MFVAVEFEELKEYTVTCLYKGDYFTALKGKTSQHLLHLAAASTGDFNVINEIVSVLKCKKTNSPQIIRHALLLFIGVGCLELFIHLNWTGPSDPQHRMGILPGCNQETDQLILQRLREGGQPLNNPMINVPLILFLAKTILVENEESMDMCQTASVWALRCMAVLRPLLDESNEITKNRIFSEMEKGVIVHVEDVHQVG